MKRRQKPIILITVLVICAGLVFIMSSAQNQKPGQAPPPPSDAAPVTGQDTPATNQAAVANSVKDSLKSKMPAGKPNNPMARRPGVLGMPGGGPPSGPSILQKKMEPYKPAPSDTNVNSGWYSSEAPKSYTPPKK